ncbi:uncharacterized protein LOC142568311 [Dermacentor variabilis]|uniref:uncharacterized protein LOC142568311 n=1 Tax=Dermacentor variabilis TaxID=34621 RepID=UPI003F5B3108
MPRTSLNAGKLPAGVPPSRRPPLLPTPTMPKPPECDESANSKEMPLRILCLDSGRGPPTASQLRQLLGFPGAVDRVVPCDRCEVAVYENPVSAAHVTLQLERPPKDTFMQIVVKWCDLEIVQHVLSGGVARKCDPPEWWLASEELEERCNPYDSVIAMEHKDIPVTAFALGCLLGYNTFVAHFDSARTAPPGTKTSSSKKSSNFNKYGMTKFAKWKKAELDPRSGYALSGGSSLAMAPCRKLACEAKRFSLRRASANSERSSSPPPSPSEPPADSTSSEISSSAPPSQPAEEQAAQELPSANPAESAIATSENPPSTTSTPHNPSATAADTAERSLLAWPLLADPPSCASITTHPRSSDTTEQRSSWQGWLTPVAPPVPEPPPQPFRPGPQPAIIQTTPPPKEKGKWAALLTPKEEDLQDCVAPSSHPSSSPSQPPAPSTGSSVGGALATDASSAPSSAASRAASSCSNSPSSPTSPKSTRSSTSQPPRPGEGFKVTQSNVHFEHCTSALHLYFVDKQDSSHTLYRLLVRYSTICRIVLCKTSPTSTTAYLHLLHTPLLYKLCAGNTSMSHCHREGDYLPQFNLSDTTPWDRAVEFGEGPFKCGPDVLGKSRVLRLAFSGPRHWEPLCNLILRTRNCAQVFYAAVRELHARDLKPVPRPSVPDYGVTYALLSVWSESFQVADELAMNPDSYKEVQRNLTTRAQDCPHALEEVLFELYFSLSQGKVFQFGTALDRLYARYRGHRVRNDAFTGSVIAQELPEHMVKVRKVILTPTRRVYLPPQLVCKSRLLQHFDTEYALRIVVRDDDCKLVSFSLGACKDDFLSAVIKPPLMHGLKIGGRHFVFLGCSTSQLRSHGVWFYARDNEGRTAETIRAGIGDLSAIHSVPKFMARLGQAFSQSLGFLTVQRHHTCIEEDIKKTTTIRRSGGDVLRREYVFSDGIGRISHVLLRKVHRALELEDGEEPCAVQIRYGGCKGMLLLDPTLPGRRIIFRQSMCKFHSEHEDLYILKTSKPRVLYLNRPMITILEQSGIKSKTFLTLQNHILDSFIDSMLDPHEAAQVLCTYCSMRLPYKELAGVGIDLTVEPFFRALVRAVNKKVLKELKTKARILIPPSSGRTMFGVLDETGTLEYGQVFVQYSNDMLRYKVNDPATILEGDVIVTKNPCMHPGDIRKLTAVNVPQLHHVRDCIVFPAKGDRPHPDEMAGSDLDGDEYSVLWYEDLIFKANCNPMNYHHDPPRERKTPIVVQDMIDFFCQYIKGDKIGLIANAHLVWADLLDAGINSRRCRDLARKCAVNLDFAKCGDLKGFQNAEKPPMYPDFMEKQDTKNTYCSRKVLGQLYRNCKKVELSTECLDVVEDTLPDPRLLLEGREAFVPEAKAAYRRYAMKIRALLKSYRIESESEALSGAVSKFSKYVKEKNDPTDVAMVLESQVEHVVRRTREEFFSQALGELQENLKASAWYQVTYELQASEGGIQSFPWVVPDVLMRILVNSSQSTCDGANASRNSFTQRLGALLLGRTPDDRDARGDQEQNDARMLNNLLKLMYDWIDSNREFLFVKEPQEVGLYKNIMRDACVKVSRSLSRDMQPHKLVILCLRFACAWCLKIFQGGSDGEVISRECRRRYRLGHLALITLNRLSMSGNLAYLRRAPEGCVSTELVRIYIDREDDEFFLIIRRYEDVFTVIMSDWSGVHTIQCDLKTDRMDEWFLQLMVTGSRWALERLKEIVVYPSFREVLSLVFKRQISQP